MLKFYLFLLLPFIGQIDQAAARTMPLFDSGGSTIIGGHSGPYKSLWFAHFALAQPTEDQAETETLEQRSKVKVRDLISLRNKSL